MRAKDMGLGCDEGEQGMQFTPATRRGTTPPPWDSAPAPGPSAAGWRSAAAPDPRPAPRWQARGRAASSGCIVRKLACRTSMPPDCRAPIRSPIPRSCRSSSAISKPSLVAANALRRSGVRPPESRMQWLFPTPRPMRPRSWCSCASPNRSGCSTSDHGRVRHVDPDLDDRRRHQDLHDRRRGSGASRGRAPPA